MPIWLTARDTYGYIKSIANLWINSLTDLENTNNKLDKLYYLPSTKLFDNTRSSQT